MSFVSSSCWFAGRAFSPFPALEENEKGGRETGPSVQFHTQCTCRSHFRLSGLVGGGQRTGRAEWDFVRRERAYKKRWWGRTPSDPDGFADSNHIVLCVFYFFVSARCVDPTCRWPFGRIVPYPWWTCTSTTLSRRRTSARSTSASNTISRTRPSSSKSCRLVFSTLIFFFFFFLKTQINFFSHDEFNRYTATPN